MQIVHHFDKVKNPKPSVKDAGIHTNVYTCTYAKRSYMIYHAIWKNLFKFISVMGEANRGLWSNW